MAEWKIRRRHGECSACQKAFEEGERHASALRFDEEESLLREDLCGACWEAAAERDSEKDSAKDLVFWWFTRHALNKRTTLQLDLGSLERLFMELDGREEETLRELRYLLCLLLMRKRRLKLVRVRRAAAGECLILRRPRRQEELGVWVRDFTPERMEVLRRHLQEVLEGSGAEPEGDSDGGAPLLEEEQVGEEQAGEEQVEGERELEERSDRAEAASEEDAAEVDAPGEGAEVVEDSRSASTRT